MSAPLRDLPSPITERLMIFPPGFKLTRVMKYNKNTINTNTAFFFNPTYFKSITAAKRLEKFRTLVGKNMPLTAEDRKKYKGTAIRNVAQFKDFKVKGELKILKLSKTALDAIEKYIEKDEKLRNKFVSARRLAYPTITTPSGKNAMGRKSMLNNTIRQAELDFAKVLKTIGIYGYELGRGVKNVLSKNGSDFLPEIMITGGAQKKVIRDVAVYVPPPINQGYSTPVGSPAGSSLPSSARFTESTTTKATRKKAPPKREPSILSPLSGRRKTPSPEKKTPSPKKKTPSPKKKTPSPTKTPSPRSAKGKDKLTTPGSKRKRKNTPSPQSVNNFGTPPHSRRRPRKNNSPTIKPRTLF